MNSPKPVKTLGWVGALRRTPGKAAKVVYRANPRLYKLPRQAAPESGVWTYSPVAQW